LENQVPGDWGAMLRDPAVVGITMRGGVALKLARVAASTTRTTKASEPPFRKYC
jgi:hypothetical protein